MTYVKSIYIFLLFILIGCDSTKKVIESDDKVQKEVYVNTNNDLAIAGAVNFEDPESLSIYSAILKNVVGDKAGAYIGFQMDRLAAELERDLDYSELLRAGEGLILEFNTTNSLYFDSGKTSLNKSSKTSLNVIISALENFPKVNLVIENHTDDSGSEDVNMKMTNERVESVKNYLVENGIDSSRIITKAFGENQPKFKNDTAENRQKNRRVEIGFYASEELKEEAKNMTSN